MLMACSATCATKDHDSYGACLRAKNLRVGWAAEHKGLDLSAQKRNDKELDSYASARAQGIQPKTTRINHVRAAVEYSNQTGEAFKAAGS